VVRNSVLRDHRLSYRARGVLGSILSRPDNWTSSAESLAAEGREGRDAIRVALKELEAAGYLRRTRVRDPESGRISTLSTVYDEPVDGFSGDGEPAIGEPAVGNPGPLRSNEEEVTRRREGTNVPSSRMKGARAKRVAARAYTDEFEGFWQTYHKSRGPKPAAFDAWEKAMERGVDPQAIRDMAAQHTKVWMAEGRENHFVPHAATWLNGDRWESEIEASSTGSTLKGNAQTGKSYLPFEYDNDQDLVEKLGAKVYGKPQD
jgi:hypothetical protein